MRAEIEEAGRQVELLGPVVHRVVALRAAGEQLDVGLQRRRVGRGSAAKPTALATRAADHYFVARLPVDRFQFRRWSSRMMEALLLLLRLLLLMGWLAFLPGNFGLAR